MPADERNALHRLVAAAHAEGRQVHFAGLPERGWRVREAFWCELAAAGVDLITTTRPRALANFLRGYGEPAPALATVRASATRTADRQPYPCKRPCTDRRDVPDGPSGDRAGASRYGCPPPRQPVRRRGPRRYAMIGA